MKHFISAIVLLLAACAQAPDAAADGQALARLVGPPSGPAQDCITPGSGEGLTVLGAGAVGYRSGRTVWVSHMPGQCRLSTFATVIVERHGARICRGDLVRTIETGASIPGPTCVLGPFVPHAAQ